MCDDYWHQVDANVICHQLGYSNSGSQTNDAVMMLDIYQFDLQMLPPSIMHSYFGQGIVPIKLDKVACSGSESQLLICSYDSNTADCSHHEDAGVRCQEG